MRESNVRWRFLKHLICCSKLSSSRAIALKQSTRGNIVPLNWKIYWQAQGQRFRILVFDRSWRHSDGILAKAISWSWVCQLAYAARRILAGICTRYRWETIFTTSGGEFKLSLLGAKFGTLNLNSNSAVKYQFEQIQIELNMRRIFRKLLDVNCLLDVGSVFAAEFADTTLLADSLNHTWEELD